MSIKALNGFGWYLSVMIVAPACYLVSSQVAAERSKVEAVERAIVQAHKDIRGLETEFDTRSNLAQLERWNGQVMRYVAPTSAQFLESDRELAALRPIEGDGLANRYAVMVVPQGAPQPVSSAASEAQAVPAAPVAKPAMTQVAKAEPVKSVAPKAAIADDVKKNVAQKAVAQKAVAQKPEVQKSAPKQVEVASVKKPEAAPKKETVKLAQAAKPIQPASGSAVVTKPVRVKEEAVAAMDRKLLRDSSFGDLMNGVKAEARRVR